MDEHIIHLTDGTTISAKVNFATLYYMQKYHLETIINRIQKDKDAGNEENLDDELEASAKMLYVLLLSNGRQVTFEDSLTLIPLEIWEIEDVFMDFQNRLVEFKKKLDAEQQRRKFIETQTM